VSEPPTTPRYRDDISEYADIAFQILAAQISSNYLKYFKARVVPELGEFADAPLRELRTLMTIAHFADPVKGSRISRLLSYDPATVTRSTRWLIERGLVKAEENPRDARSIVYGLTQKGLELSDLYRDLSRQSIVELNEEDPERPRKKEILKAISVLENVRDRSQYAAELGAAHRLARKQNR
jgi:DNA-binding MarR family transcriptional regulator